MISNCTTFYNSIAVYNDTVRSCNFTQVERINQECLLFKSEIKWQITIAVFGFITILFQILPMIFCREEFEQQETKVQSFISGFFAQPFMNKIKVFKILIVRKIFGGNKDATEVKTNQRKDSLINIESPPKLPKKPEKSTYIWFLLRKLICSSITIEIASEALDMTYRTDLNFHDNRHVVSNILDFQTDTAKRFTSVLYLDQCC